MPATRAAALSDTALPLSVVYIHGIGRQDPAPETKRQWDTALFGRAMADTALAYWADIRHPDPSRPGARAVGQAGKALDGAEAKRFMRDLEKELGLASAAGGGPQAKVFSWMPGVGDKLFEWLTKGFIRDTAAYFFDAATRRAMQKPLLDVLDRAAHRPIILVAHSQGSIIAYDVLRRLDGRAPSGRPLDVKLLVTVGSPLGVDEIQSRLGPPLVVPRGVGAWHNFADTLDPVALDKELQGEFSGDVTIRDVSVKNLGRPNPHSSVGYLATPEVRKAVYSPLGWNELSFGARVRKDVLADVIQDVARRELEGDEPAPEERRAVLIELRDEAGFGAEAYRGLVKGTSIKTLDDHRDEVVAFLEQHTSDPEAASIDPLQRFVAARLTPSEIQHVEAECQTSVYCLWKNSRKRALISRSGDVVQVPPARTAYRAEGAGVTWAVLDTGVQSDHPHFKDAKNVVAVWDCTRRGAPVPMLSARRPAPDPNGHGTHVCGIIAGGTPGYQGLAVKAHLHVYKVLDDDGFGEDGWIIKAVQHIVEQNRTSADLAIHGVNLSLGGSFDPEVYGCGHSPICQELRRLWRQGAVVCVACGNEGTVDVTTPDGIQKLNAFLSIGDPANLEECIAVGSVNADRPHSYGISYFSSRGPTADGRPKPDVVAPGERIASCNSRFASGDEKSYYVALSGTSMATPHVSGLIAAFLSVRREFVGRPDEVKRLLIDNCTDLGRDRYLQGAGVPNLVKMLANT